MYVHLYVKKIILSKLNDNLKINNPFFLHQIDIRPTDSIIVRYKFHA